MSDLAPNLNTRHLLTRAHAVQTVAGAVVGVIAVWAALGLPVAASRGWVEAQYGDLRSEVLEARVDITDSKLFMIDWTLRQTPLDPQPRAVIEAERLRLLDRKTAITAKLERIRSTKN
jgi:hypothetical protein